MGSYVVEEFVGQGAMGVVFRAYHAQLERTAAVKVLQALTPDPDMVARFRREAQSIGRMRHANVLNVFDFGEFEGTPYMIVEYVEGGSLAGHTKQGRLDRGAALAFLRGIGDALDYAHSLGIVHRDVKPANVLLGARDTPILADFGLAKLLQSSSIKSMTGVTTGTPAYMAPEQVTGSQVGPAADRYSLAVMAFEMLTGSLPFDADGVLEVLYAHVHRDPPAPSSLNPELGPEVDAVVLRGMAKDPAARWDSCASFVSALAEAFVLTPPVASVDSTLRIAPPAAVGAGAAVPATTVATPPAAPPPVAATTAVAMPPPRKRSRRGLLFALLAAALVLVLIVGGVVVYAATRPTTLAVSPQIVRPGEHIVVTARHVPPNQAGDVQLVGTSRSVAFRANANGDVSVEMTVPAEVSGGDYILRICWGGTCHASTTLRVLPSVAFVTPGVSPSPGLTPGVSPSAGPSPRTSATPGASPTHTGSNPSPTPPPPCPIPTASPKLTASPTTGAGGSNVTVSGTNFWPTQDSPYRNATVSYYQGSVFVRSYSTFVGCNESFSQSVRTNIAVGPRTDHVTACDENNRCATAYFSIIL